MSQKTALQQDAYMLFYIRDGSMPNMGVASQSQGTAKASSPAVKCKQTKVSCDAQLPVM